jgi:hypothetical protein
MRSIHLKAQVGGFVLPFFAVLAVALFSGATVQAQYRNDGYYERGQGEGRRGNRGQGQQCRRDRGQGQARRNDRNRRNDRYDDAYYRNGQYGRNDGYGNYDGYNNGGYGNNGSYNNGYRIEQDQGFQAGLNTGASDAQRGQSYNPQRSHYYRDASSEAFRNGFLQGYDQGYRQYGDSANNGRYRRSSNIGNILGGILGRP